MLATAIGVLLATTLMCTAVSHSSSLATAGLLYTLDPQTVTGAHDLQVTVFNRPIGRTDQANLDFFLSMQEWSATEQSQIWNDLHPFVLHAWLP